MTGVDKAAIWWGMAQKARLAARDLHDGALRLQMLMIAARYEAIARRAEALEAGGCPHQMQRDAV